MKVSKPRSWRRISEILHATMGGVVGSNQQIVLKDGKRWGGAASSQEMYEDYSKIGVPIIDIWKC